MIELTTRTPDWIDRHAVADIYELSASMGYRYEVDHIVPLNSLYVCGLHVEYNMVIITKVANRLKSNTHWPDMWSEQLQLFP